MNSFHPLRSSLLFATRFLFILFLVVLPSAFPLRAQSVTRVVTSAGEVYKGTIERETVDTIVLKSESGVAFIIPRSSARTVDYLYVESDDKEIGYWSFGGAFGTPAGINLVVARNFDRNRGLRLSGLYIGNLSGVQLDGTQRVGGTGSFSHGLYVGIGFSEFKYIQALYEGVTLQSDRWLYAAGGYELNWGGLHAALGLSVGYGDYSNPLPSFQVGYLHHFR